MTRRDWFQIGGTLLGIGLLVTGLGSIAQVVTYLRAFPDYRPFENGLVAELLLWSGVAVFVLAGILLVWRAKAWSRRLFPDDEQHAATTASGLSPADSFEVGLKLLGAALLVTYVPHVILEAERFVQDKTGARDARRLLSAVFVAGAAVVFIFGSRWVAVVVGLRKEDAVDPADNGSADDAS